MNPPADVYAGFDSPSSVGDTYSRPRLSAFQRSPTALVTANAIGSERPPTSSKRAAGYTRQGSRTPSGLLISPSSRRPGGDSGSVVKSLEQRKREMEARISRSLDECYEAYGNGSYALALDRAKDAVKRDRAYVKDLQSSTSPIDDDQPPVPVGNPDLTFCSVFALATMFQVNSLHADSVAAFESIVRDKQFHMSGRLRINMAHVYMELGKFQLAVKMYRMALDLITDSNRRLRALILKNIGVASLKVGRIAEAVDAFESALELLESHDVVYNLLVCYHALKDVDLMKHCFQRLVQLELPVIDSSISETDKNAVDDENAAGTLHQDSLREYALKKRHAVEKNIVMAARMVAPEILDSFDAGFDWVLEIVRASAMAHVSGDIENAKALYMVKMRRLTPAIDLLKEFEKRGYEKFSTTATNLSALLFGQRDIEQAEKYADLAMKSDRFNTHALNNLAACQIQKGSLQSANSTLTEVVSIDSLSPEGLYNKGLTLLAMDNFVDALKVFEKLHQLDRHDIEVLYQLAEANDRIGEPKQALEWLNRVLSLAPTDRDVLCKVASLYTRLGDKAQAYHYYSEAYRYYPDDIDLLTWLGAYFVETELYERAITCFYRATLIQPEEVKWQLMIASCQRRSGNYQLALDRYKKVHKRFPDNAECLRLLVRLASDMGLSGETQEYSELLNAVEKKQRIQTAGLDMSFNNSVVTKSNVSVNSATGSANRSIVNERRAVQEEVNWADENVDSLLPD